MPVQLEGLDDALLRVLDREAIEVDVVVGRIDRETLADEGLVERRVGVVHRRRDDATDQGEPRGDSKSRWSWPGTAHDRAGAVSHQHVVGDEDRDGNSVQRIGRPRAREGPLSCPCPRSAARRRPCGKRRADRRRPPHAASPTTPPPPPSPRASPSGEPPCGTRGVDERVLGRNNHEGGTERVSGRASKMSMSASSSATVTTGSARAHPAIARSSCAASA